MQTKKNTKKNTKKTQKKHKKNTKKSTRFFFYTYTQMFPKKKIESEIDNILLSYESLTNLLCRQPLL
jgi:hypothetical protein